MVLHGDKPSVTVAVGQAQKLGELPCVHAGGADIECFSLIDDICQRFKVLLHRCGRIVSMNLIKVDVIDP